MASNLVTIAKYYDHLEASVAKQALEENGIAAVIVGESLCAAIGEVPALALIELQVNEERVAEAVEILEELGESRSDSQDDFQNENDPDKPEDN